MFREREDIKLRELLCHALSDITDYYIYICEVYIIFRYILFCTTSSLSGLSNFVYRETVSTPGYVP